jgi:all-trans-retinol dehydrogenase (NAD+)
MDLFFLIVTFILIFIFVKITSTVFKPKKNIRGKIALVTGGGNGLGKGISLNLAKKGCNILIADIDIEAAKKTSAEISQTFGVKSKAYKVDVSIYDEVQKLKEEIKGDFGDVDILVNNAGLISYNTILSEPSKFIEKMINVNLNGVVYMTKCFFEEMYERKSGHVVTVASLAGIYHHAYGVSYCTTKFGVVGFMMSLKEFIRVKNLQKYIKFSLIMPDVIGTRDDVVASVSEK